MSKIRDKMVKFEDMYKKILFILLFSGCVHLLQARNIEPIKECLVRLNCSMGDFYKEQKQHMDTFKLVSKSMNIYLVQLNTPYYEIKDEWEKHPEVLVVQRNRTVQRRLVPNDPLYTNQYQFSKIGMEAAWNQRIGGLTHNNDTIVVAIIDDGVDVSHPDLAGNHFINYGEIPNDNMDNDSNGYIDDYEGWNAIQQSNEIFDPIEKARHGTPITGIIAAKGNNNYGVSGMNWNIKYLVVVGGIEIADILESYDYVLQMKKLYLETNGKKGAYIVSSNSSWGRDGAKKEDEPLWCAMYDSLGKYGIINMAATSNVNSNVDVQGDLPSDCVSDFIVAVANVNNKEEIQGGYGIQNVDVAAYGSNVTCTASWVDSSANGGWFKSFNGTSASTPFVTGAVGVLYANACQSFLNLHDRSPDSAALLAKQFIIDGVTESPFLANKLSSGGVLNVQTMLQKMEDWCAINKTSIVVEDQINPSLYPNPTESKLIVDFGKNRVGEIVVYSLLGKKVMEIAFIGNKTTLDLSKLNNGVYVLAFTEDGTNSTSVSKFVKVN